VSTPIKAINPHPKPPAVSLAFFTPGRPAGHQWQAAGRPVPYPPHLPSSGPILARARTPVPPFRLCNAHTHTPSTNFASAAASAPSRRRANVAVGEVHRRLALFFPVHDHGPHVMLVDQGKPPQETNRAWSLGPHLPERRPSRRRRRTPSLPLSLHP
jgi:hypothetical protein